MASVFSTGVSKITSVGVLTRLCKISQNHNVIQVAFMKRLSLRDVVQKPAPFPYWDKQLTIYQAMKTSIVMRYDENTRVIVVDGPPAVGKSKLCEHIAEQFGLLYMPPPSHEEIYINPYKVDLRKLDSKLPLHCQSYDIERFLANPNDVRVPFFQIMYLLMRFEQYTNALLHLLSTGQGIVLNRCVYSDIAFADAMHKAGYLSKDVMREYMYMREEAVRELFRPHLIIYLDVPPELVKEKIKKRGHPHEVNSKILTTKYLSDIESAYKEKYLKSLKDHSQLLIYDWSTEGNLMDVVHDIEGVDLDTFKKPKLTDWIFGSVTEIYSAIELYQDKLPIINEIYHTKSVPPRELYWTAEENDEMDNVMSSEPTEQFLYDFNPLYGDKVLFKSDNISLHPFRRTPRDFVNRDVTKL
ncbi:NADH dehydrogenase (ubiquinone) subunit ND-42 [Megachile rotundata]|uniref:NADH dehydrogenase (ubiquinone) subunit ND-42 n=1 Tax=Megachile rotundata TaxID=143995 RepID=UPI003FD692B3